MPSSEEDWEEGCGLGGGGSESEWVGLTLAGEVENLVNDPEGVCVVRAMTVLAWGTKRLVKSSKVDLKVSFSEL